MTIPTNLLVGWGLIARVATAALSSIWKSTGICLGTKLRLLNSLIFSIALYMYMSESWVLEERDKKKIENFELWCYRRVVRISWTERVTNNTILGTFV